MTSAVPSRATRVTLFEDRAEITRAAEVEIPAGIGRVTLAGASPFVDERSVQARIVADGEFGRILSARVIYHAHAEKALGREAIEALADEAKAARRRIAEADQALDRASRAAARARSLAAKWIEGVRAVPRRARDAEVLAKWKAALASIEEAAGWALGQSAEARRERLAAADELARTEARLAQGSIETPRFEARIEVEIEARAAHRATVEVTYRVPAALWRPEHLVRLMDPASVDGVDAKIEVVTFATAWQRTGELWDDVDVRFSTARPARAASPPLVADDTLSARRKTDQERRRIEVDLREQAIAVAGLDRGARAVDEMPGVDDGGEPVSLRPKGKVTIASDGLPFRVEVSRVTLDATIDRVLLPEIARVAHLRATATLEHGGPLLAGPVRVARGASLVGRAKIDYVGKGEPFEIGLGPDDGVRVRRAQTEERDTAAVTGTQKIRRQVKVHLSNLSSDPKKVLVTERVPVSEIEDVEIAVFEPGGFRADGKDGLYHREITLAPHATETLELGYEIRAASRVVLPM